MFAAINSFQTAGGVAAPVNTVAPAVTGNAYSTYSLTTTTGTWTGTGITYTYQWQHTTTNISGATSSSYTVSSAYVGETIRCVVTATNSAGNASANSNATAAIGATGQAAYTTAGASTFIVPAGVTSISVLAVGGAPAYSGGAGLSYASNRTVTPGASIVVSVQQGASYITQVYAGTISPPSGSNTCWAVAFGSTGYAGGYGGTQLSCILGRNVGIGGSGGAGSSDLQSKGGAGGYSGTGGAGAPSYNSNGSAGSGGGGGGGGRGCSSTPAGGGGGVGLLGGGSSGAGGTWGYYYSGGGGGGSGGTGGSAGTVCSAHTCCTASYLYCVPGVGGPYGGGGGGSGGARIIWPGQLRQYPSTCTADR